MIPLCMVPCVWGWGSLTGSVLEEMTPLLNRKMPSEKGLWSFRVPKAQFSRCVCSVSYASSLFPSTTA